jgi:hypothetical protein
MANPQCLNRYSYCLNNPLKYTDPSGHVNVDSDDGGATDVTITYNQNGSVTMAIKDKSGESSSITTTAGSSPPTLFDLVNARAKDINAQKEPTLPITKTSEESGWQKIKENPGEFWGGVLKYSIGTGLAGAGVVVAVFGSESGIAILGGTALTGYGYSLMVDGIEQASFEGVTWPKIPFFDEIIKTGYEVLDNFKEIITNAKLWEIIKFIY